MLKLQHMSLPQPTFKSTIISGVSGGLGIIGMIVAVALYIVHTITQPKRSVGFNEDYKISPYELELPAEEVTFSPTHGKHQVSGWYIPYPNSSCTIIVCPGYRTDRAAILGASAHLWRAGYTILGFEYYGHGAIVNEPVTLGYREVDDFLAAIDYAKQRDPHTTIGVLSYSMGAAVAIMACARSNDVEALIADSAFATHKGVVEYAVRRTLHLPFFIFAWITDILLWLQAGYHFSQVEPLRSITSIAPRPILLIHGLADTVVDPHDANRLYDAAKDPKELWLLPGADHCGVYFLDRQAYVSKVLHFFDFYLQQKRLSNSA